MQKQEIIIPARDWYTACVWLKSQGILHLRDYNYARAPHGVILEFKQSEHAALFTAQFNPS